VFTLHAEIEGMGRRNLFRELLAACKNAGVQFIRMDDYARELLTRRSAIPCAIKCRPKSTAAAAWWRRRSRSMPTAAQSG